MYVLKVANTQPAMYIAANNGFFDKVDTVTQALQLVRMGDAQEMQDIIVDTTEIVSA